MNEFIFNKNADTTMPMNTTFIIGWVMFKCLCLMCYQQSFMSTYTVPDTPKFPFNARIRLYWPLVRSHSICSHSLSGECELMRYIWPKANARIRGHSCAHSHLGISHSHNSINYPIQMRALASRCYAHSHYLALLKQSIFQSKRECASSQSIVSTHDCKPWGPLWSVCYQ